MYQAIIAKLEDVRKHPNADKLQLATVCGHQVVVDMARFNGNVGVFFPPDGRLSHEFMLQNHLYNQSAIKELEIPNVQSFGFFDTSRRVRAQRFRGEKSEGIWLPLECLGHNNIVDLDAFPVGCAFDSVGGTVICEKYVNPKTQGAAQINRTKKKGELADFPKHVDTEQWGYYKGEIPVGSLITVTEKLHGTSHRVGYVKNSDKRWWQFWKPSYIIVHGSRNVVLNSGNERNSFYGTDQFRYTSTMKLTDLTLHKGEVLYGEIVGDVSVGTPIMPSAQVDRKDLPNEYAQYGPKMSYTYGCEPGTAKFVLYRIVQFSPDGHPVELSHSQLTKRAHELGYDVPWGFYQTILVDDQREQLDRVVSQFTEGSSQLDARHIREGVVARIDTPDGRTYFLKNKSFAFKVLEGIIKTDANYIDMEESN